MEEKRVADYFLVVGRPEENPAPLDELSNESALKATHKLDPIVDIAIINRSFGEVAPPKFKCIEFTPTGFPADLNHGSIRAPEMYLCFKRGRDKPPLVDIGVLYDGKDTKERVLAGCEVIYNTVQGRSANVNNSGSTRIYVTYRRASPTATCNTLAVTDICVILLNKGETAPHAYHTINKTLNKGMMGSDVYLCYKKSMTKTNVLAYKSAILSRYPTEDFPGLPLPDRVAMFCLPLGATLECWPADAQQPRPVFSTFILTAASGDKVYGAAVTFYELQDKEKLDESQLKQLGLLDENTSTSVNEEDASSSTTVHQNKCICLLSRLPYFETFKKFLGFLYKMSHSGSHQIPIERYIAHFLSDVPFPSPQRPRILIQLSNTSITLSQPDETPLPKSGASFVELLKNLGPANCITVLLFTLMEQKLLIHSLRPAVLTSVAEAVANIIFPFHWQCPYIPLCPLALSYVLNSPTPFIVGIDSRYFDLYDPPSDVTCIDLDTNTLTISDDRKGQTTKMMPKKAVKVLKTTLEKLYEHMCQNPAVSDSSNQEWLDVEEGQSETDFSGWKKEMHMETSIQEAFLRFMAVILKGYNNFLLPIIKAPTIVTTDVSNLFDIQGFLKSRDRSYHKFYQAMMKTQAFSRFIEERSFVSDKDTCLAFFDECVEKVDENSHDVHLIDMEDSLQSERTVFVPPPEPVGLQEDVEYSYNGFPLLDLSLIPPVVPLLTSQTIAMPKLANGGDANLSFLCSPMTRRTKHELKSAQKIAMKHSNIPKMWANCLVWHCYSLWFIHLPAYLKTVHSKTKALRIAYDVLGKAQSERLQPPDEVCYRVMMQLCGLYHQPVMAVRVLFEMKRNGVQPNAVTYGFYNKAVLESKWPTADTRGYQLWTLLRHVIMAVAQFKQSWHTRRQSVYSNSESDLDGHSLDSYLDSEPVGATIIKDVKNKSLGKRSRTGSETGPSHALVAANEERISTGGLSDRGYGSSTFEEGKRISLILGSQNSLDLPAQRPMPSDERTPTESDPTSSPSRHEDNGHMTQSVDLKDGSKTPDHTMTSSSSCETVASSPIGYAPMAASAADMGAMHQNFGAENRVADDDVDAGSQPIGMGDVTLTTYSDDTNQEGGEIHGPNSPSRSTEMPRKDDNLLHDSDLPSPDTNPDLDTGGSQSSSVASPVHNLLVPVTENDPLGVFSSATASNNVNNMSSSQHDKDNNVMSQSQHILTDIQPFSQTINLSESDEIDNNVNGTIPSEDTVEPVSQGVIEKPASSRKGKSNRADIFGNVMRSAATRLFSKYNDIKKSMSTQGTKADSGSLSSINSEGVEPGAAAVASDNSSTEPTVNDSEVDGVCSDSNELTPPKSRLRVPGLYAPLATMLGGLKTKEALQGIASSLEYMTTSVRDSFRESWNYSSESRDGDMQEGREGDDGRSATEDDLDDESAHKHLNSHNDMDQLVPVEESSDRGSLTGDQSSFRFSTGSMLSLPQSSAPMEVEMCTLSKCQACGNLLYDEEIMAGWTSDDSNLNASCQFCGQGVVPFIHIYIRDYRQSMRSPMSNLSQSVESMLSVQSAPVAANRKVTVDPLSNSENPVDLQRFPPGEEANPSGPLRLTSALETMQETATESDNQAESVTERHLQGTHEADVEVEDHQRLDERTVVKVSVEVERSDDICDADSKTNGSQQLQVDSGETDSSRTLEHENVENAEANVNGSACVDTIDVKDNTVSDITETHNVGHIAVKDQPSVSDKALRRVNKCAVHWHSKDLELGLSCPEGVRRQIDSRHLENRRCTSECALNLLTPDMDVGTKCSHSRQPKRAAAVEKVLNDDGTSIMSNGSDDKNGLSARKFVELDPITVPYLSPLVLRKELENVLDQDGDLCLNRPEFVDQHPILFWNLVWYFKRLDVPSHMPGFILTAKSLNKSATPLCSAWSSGDSRHVAIICMWDNVRLHQDHGPPMYILWNQASGSNTTSGVNEVSEMFPKGTMVTILNHIKKNDVISPLRLILKERNKRRMQTSKTRFHSVYRDLLFLSFTALGRENIDHEAFDHEFKKMFLELPTHDSARLRIADRTPSSTANWCRKMFQELQLPVF